MHNKAVEMEIGMRGNERMHAEASFLRFLLHRAEKEEYARGKPGPKRFD